MNTKAKILGIIPARGGSKGLPGKNIIPFFGKPLIAHTISAAKKSHLIDRLVVSTDDEEIASVAQHLNMEVVKRPKNLSKDTSPIDDALRHAVRYLQKQDNYKADIVVLMHANVPIRKTGVIDKVISLLIKTNTDSVVTVYKISQRPEWMMYEHKHILKPFLPNAKGFRRQDLPKLYMIDGAVAAIKADVLMATSYTEKPHVYLGRSVRFIEQDPGYSIEIDSELDLTLAEAAVKKLFRKKS